MSAARSSSGATSEPRRVIVVGGGLGGLATALRLAKLGDQVTLIEAGERLGGAVTARAQDGFTWDAGPVATLLPAVLRDLFRKTGRPLEREIDLEPQPWIREHRFADGTRLRLPGGSRAAQVAAIEELGSGLGRSWAGYVDSLGEVWEVVRRGFAEPWEILPGRHAGWVADQQTGRPEGAAEQAFVRLAGRRLSLERLLTRSLSDPRLREVAGFPLLAAGQRLARVPAWCGLVSYLEQRFGSWSTAHGLAPVTGALVRRLETRGVTVRTGVPVRDVLLRAGGAVGLATADGDLDADAIVVAGDPRALPALRSRLRPAPVAMPPMVTHLGLRADWSDLFDGDRPTTPAEFVLADGTVLRVGGVAPAGHLACTVQTAPGRRPADPLAALAAADLDIRDRVVTRLVVTPAEQLHAWQGSPMGLQWRGRRTLDRMTGPTTPIPGVLAAGAHAVPGAGVPFVGMSAALVAQALHPNAYR